MELGLCARLLGGFGILLWIGGRRKRGDVGHPDHICFFLKVCTGIRRALDVFILFLSIRFCRLTVTSYLYPPNRRKMNNYYSDKSRAWCSSLLVLVSSWLHRISSLVGFLMLSIKFCKPVLCTCIHS